jgi:hypothetical protein
MSARRQVSGLGALVGVGALAALCCVAVPAVLGAITGAAIGGLAGEGIAALVALVGVGILSLRRRSGGSRC